MDLATARPTWRQRLYVQLEPTAWPRRGLSPTNKAVCVLIPLSAFIGILETEPEILDGHELLFTRLEWLFTLIFAVEYVARLWTSAENRRYGPGLRGRFAYIRSTAALIDLVALLSIIITISGSEAFLLRIFRLVRILGLARLGRFSKAMQHIGDAVRSRRHELALSVCAALLLLVVSSTLLYLVEGAAQPVGFGSIPRAMWWSIATLTTVGYGDVYPITAAGRLFAAITAITAIGLIAMPTGILAAAFSDAMQREKSDKEQREG